MKNVTYYLKYRPQKISELDLVSVRKELGIVLGSGRFAHAYLFAGPRGTGKTSAARILAKVVNCEKNRKAVEDLGKIALLEPCGVCSACKEITTGVALDLIEIDAASNRGIDDIRELRERIKLSPAKNPYKVYIIDEVHMLTVEAFNALLKTLEEPPAHALFILCTTELYKIPETIQSRATRISFSKASVVEVVSSLKKILDGEGFKCEEGVLETIARAVDGSFRDGVKILEQLSLRVDSKLKAVKESKSESSKKKKERKKITISDALEVIGISGSLKARSFIEDLVNFQREKVFAEISRVSDEGSMEQFMRELLEVLRKLMLCEFEVETEEKITGLDLDSIRRLIKIFLSAGGALRTAVIIELPLELAVVEWWEQSEKGVRAEKEEKEIVETGKSDKAIRQKVMKQSKAEEIVEEKGSRDIKKSNVDFSQVEENWPMVLEKLRPRNHSVEALLKATKPIEIDGGRIIVEVAYRFHKEQLEVDRYRKMVEEVVSQVIGSGLRLRYILRKQDVGKVKKDIKEHENISGSVEDEKVVRAAEEIFGVESE